MRTLPFLLLALVFISEAAVLTRYKRQWQPINIGGPPGSYSYIDTSKSPYYSQLTSWSGYNSQNQPYTSQAISWPRSKVWYTERADRSLQPHSTAGECVGTQLFFFLDIFADQGYVGYWGGRPRHQWWCPFEVATYTNTETTIAQSQQYQNSYNSYYYPQWSSTTYYPGWRISINDPFD